jgi:hypothetical protein
MALAAVAALAMSSGTAVSLCVSSCYYTSTVLTAQHIYMLICCTVKRVRVLLCPNTTGRVRVIDWHASWALDGYIPYYYICVRIHRPHTTTCVSSYYRPRASDRLACGVEARRLYSILVYMYPHTTGRILYRPRASDRLACGVEARRLYSILVYLYPHTTGRILYRPRASDRLACGVEARRLHLAPLPYYVSLCLLLCPQTLRVPSACGM